MAEVQFARVFLATLDRKPVKLASDYVSDPKKYPSQSPRLGLGLGTLLTNQQYILPRPAHPFPLANRAGTSNSSSSPSSPSPTLLRSIHLRPTKQSASTPNLSLKDQDASQVTILDLKQHYAAATNSNLDVSRIKILHNKRPASDLKTLRDVLPSPLPAEAEFGVMILAGAGPSLSSPAEAAPPIVVDVGGGQTAMDIDSGPGSEVVAEGLAGQTLAAAGEHLHSEAFWSDLRGFLVQRLKDEGEGNRLVDLFRKAASEQ